MRVYLSVCLCVSTSPSQSKKCVCLSVCLCVYFSVCKSKNCVSICVCVSTSPFVSLKSVCIYLYVCVSTSPSVSLSIYLLISLYFRIFCIFVSSSVSLHQFQYLFVYQSVCLSVYPLLHFNSS